MAAFLLCKLVGTCRDSVIDLSECTRPDVQKFQQKKEKEEREKREGKDDRSFFQKYVRHSTQNARSQVQP